MDDTPTPLGPKPRVPAVEPDLLASAIFLFGEYLASMEEDEEALGGEDAEPEDEEEGPPIDTKAVLDLFAEELGTGVPMTLAIYMRVTALFRLLSASPRLAQMAMAGEEFGGALTDDALVAAARLDLHVTSDGTETMAEFDAREFREALDEG